jgi:hypothetical protein
LSAHSVTIGTIGKSTVIDNLIESGKLYVSDIKDKWESFIIQVVENPRRVLKKVSSSRGATGGELYMVSIIFPEISASLPGITGQNIPFHSFQGESYIKDMDG